MNTYPNHLDPCSTTNRAAQQGSDFELRGMAFLSVDESDWLMRRHAYLDSQPRPQRRDLRIQPALTR